MHNGGSPASTATFEVGLIGGLTSATSESLYPHRETPHRNFVNITLLLVVICEFIFGEDDTQNSVWHTYYDTCQFDVPL